MLARILPPSVRITSEQDLATFLDSRASFLAQKGVVEFCRVRSGAHWSKLFTEANFLSALTRSCWLSYTPALAMVAEMVEAQLRPVAGEHRQAVRDRLVELADRMRATHPLPDGLTQSQWQAQAALVKERLDAASRGAPRPVREMPSPMARLVFEALPLHVDIIANDFDYISNNLRMNLMRAYEDLLATADLPAVAESLLAR